MINIAILGLGTVASEVVKLLINNKNYKINKILVNNISKSRDLNLKNLNLDKLLTNDFNDIVYNSDIDIIIELIGGSSPALEYILQSLKNKKPVITANKQVLALYGDKIISTALKYNTAILFEASVCAGIPIIRSVINSFHDNDITKFLGILNGTSNYILTNMYLNNLDFDHAVKQAQQMGYAEADPSSDTDGFDAAYKSNILASLCFKQNINQSINNKYFKKIHIEGINYITKDDIINASRLKYVIKLISYSIKLNNKIYIATFPALLNIENGNNDKNIYITAHINNIDNIININSELYNVTNYIGPGAGGKVTAASVIADLNNIKDHFIDNNCALDLDFYNNLNNNFKYGSIDELSFKFYISLTIKKINDSSSSLNNIANNRSSAHIYIKDIINKIRDLANKQDIELILATANNIDNKEYIIILTNDILNSKIDKFFSSLLVQDFVDNNIDNSSKITKENKYIRIMDGF